MASLVLNYACRGWSRRHHWLNLLPANTGGFLFLRPTQGRFWTSARGALLRHSRCVESVAWISREDVLFAFFYLAGLIAYGST
jgi:hypothetical protein